MSGTIGTPTEADAGQFHNASLMSGPAIREAIEAGDILFLDGDPENIRTSSVDLRLGSWFWKETSLEGEYRVFDPHSLDDVNRVWGQLWFAPRHRWWIREKNIGSTLVGIDPDARMFLIPPGCQILCHTREFVGGTSRDITTMMKARSGVGRSFLEVCRCAGWGDHGFCNRWTQEMHNSSAIYNIPLVVGYRYPQMVFFRTRELAPEDADYRADGKYQQGSTGEEIRRSWTPEIMRPAMYRDKEVPRLEDQRLYYRCDNPDCGRDGAERLGQLDPNCSCGSPRRVYKTPRASEKVWPLYDMCVECGYVYQEWIHRSLVECKRFRAREEESRGDPEKCVKCEHGYRHFLGGAYEVCNPDPPAPG